MLRDCGLYSFSYIREIHAQNRDKKRWKYRYRFLETEISSKKANRAHFPMLHTTFFSQESMYFLKDPYITLPTRPPKRVSVPFNFGLQYSVGTLDIPETEATPRYDLRIVSAKVVLDWLPSSDFTSLLQFNFGIEFSAQFYEKGSLEKDLFILAPFTAFGLRLRLASKSGRRSFDVNFNVIPAWISEDKWRIDINAQAVYRMIVLAVNDQPLFLRIDSKFCKRGFSRLVDQKEIDWSLTAGLEVSFQFFN